MGNLPYEADEQKLRKWFDENGFPAEEIEIGLDRFSGQPRGFAIVLMSEELVKRCVTKCNGRNFLGRNLIVNEAHPLLEKRPGPRLERT